MNDSENEHLRKLSERVAAFDLENELNLSSNQNDDDNVSALYDDGTSTLFGDTASTLYDDTASTLYDDTATTLYSDTASTLYNDTASTLFGDSESTLGGGDDTFTLDSTNKIKQSEKHITKGDLMSLKVVTTGVELKANAANSKEITIYCVLSIRQILRRKNTPEDAINNRYREIWSVEKNYNDISKFNANLKQLGFSKIGRLPDKKVFNGQTPSNADERKLLIDTYFRILLSLSLPVKDVSCICDFLNSNIANSRQKNFGRTTKEGYMVGKEGAFFGGIYKIRYWVLQGTQFQCYATSAGGLPIDLIPLENALFATLVPPKNTSPDKQHALKVLQVGERGLDDRKARVFYAPSKKELDQWLQGLSGVGLIFHKQEREREYKDKKGKKKARLEARKETKEEGIQKDSLLQKMSQKGSSFPPAKQQEELDKKDSLLQKISQKDSSPPSPPKQEMSQKYISPANN